MCMKNLKLTVVIVLVCLVSRNVMFHINYSIGVLLLVWFIVHSLFLCWQKVLISKRQLLLTILGNDDAQTRCLLVSGCFQVILYIIVSAACGGLSWPSCVHQWNKIEDEREGEEEEDLKKRRRPCSTLHASGFNRKTFLLLLLYLQNPWKTNAAPPPPPPALFLIPSLTMWTLICLLDEEYQPHTCTKGQRPCGWKRMWSINLVFC